MTIRLHIILECPPAGFDFGLQKGSGSKFEPVRAIEKIKADSLCSCSATCRAKERAAVRIALQLSRFPDGS
jgi:hypothetical protein